MEKYREKTEEFHRARREAIDAFWTRYQDGEFPTPTGTPMPAPLEIISGNHLSVQTTYSEQDGSLRFIEVRDLRAADTKGLNFMGFDPEERCWAFRGEARHQDTFLDIALGGTHDENVTVMIQAPSGVMVPQNCLVPELEYDDFAGQVEIIEAAVWLKGVGDDDNEDASNYEFHFISILEDTAEIRASNYINGTSVRTSPDNRSGRELIQHCHQEDRSSLPSDPEDRALPRTQLRTPSPKIRQDGHGQERAFQGLTPIARQVSPVREIQASDSDTERREQMERDAAIAAELYAEEVRGYTLRTRGGVRMTRSAARETARETARFDEPSTLDQKVPGKSRRPRKSGGTTPTIPQLSAAPAQNGRTRENAKPSSTKGGAQRKKKNTGLHKGP